MDIPSYSTATSIGFSIRISIQHSWTVDCFNNFYTLWSFSLQLLTAKKIVQSPRWNVLGVRVSLLLRNYCDKPIISQRRKCFFLFFKIKGRQVDHVNHVKLDIQSFRNLAVIQQLTRWNTIAKYSYSLHCLTMHQLLS